MLILTLVAASILSSHAVSLAATTRYDYDDANGEATVTRHIPHIPGTPYLIVTALSKVGDQVFGIPVVTFRQKRGGWCRADKLTKEGRPRDEKFS